MQRISAEAVDQHVQEVAAYLPHRELEVLRFLTQRYQSGEATSDKDIANNVLPGQGVERATNNARVIVARLRKQLAAFYRDHGATAVRIVVPDKGYDISFQMVEADEPQNAGGLVRRAPSPRRFWVGTSLGAAVMGVLAVVVAFVLPAARRAAPPVTPAEMAVGAPVAQLVGYAPDAPSSDVDRAYNRGVSLMNLGDCKSALPQFTAAIKAAPKNTDAYYNRGVCYMRTNQHEQGISDFTYVISNVPVEQSVKARYNRAVCFMTVKKYRDALADFSSIVQNHAAM